MASELLTGLGIFKSLFDIAKGLKDIKDAPARNAAIIELQEKIFSAHSAQSALVENVHELEAEVARLKAWEGEKERYELKRWGDGAFAYVLKPSEARGAPPHAICPNCYEEGKKSLLQSNREPQWTKHVWGVLDAKPASRRQATRWMPRNRALARRLNHFAPLGFGSPFRRSARTSLRGFGGVLRGRRTASSRRRIVSCSLC